MLNKNEMAACKKILKNDKVYANKFIIDNEAIVCTHGGMLLVFKRDTDIAQQIQLNNETILSLPNAEGFSLNEDYVEIHSGNAIYNARFTPSSLNYQRVIPETLSGEAANFDTKYLNIIYALVKSENGTGYFKIQYNGINPARVDINENCFAIIAPLNLG